MKLIVLALVLLSVGGAITGMWSVLTSPLLSPLFPSSVPILLLFSSLFPSLYSLSPFPLTYIQDHWIVTLRKSHLVTRYLLLFQQYLYLSGVIMSNQQSISKSILTPTILTSSSSTSTIITSSRDPTVTSLTELKPTRRTTTIVSTSLSTTTSTTKITTETIYNKGLFGIKKGYGPTLVQVN